MKNILLRYYKTNKNKIHGKKYPHKEENVKKLSQYSELTLYYLEIKARKRTEKSEYSREKSIKIDEKTGISRINNKNNNDKDISNKYNIYYKLGITHNIEKRIQSLGINKDYDARVVFLIKSKCVIRLFLLEQFIHSEYKYFRAPEGKYIIENGVSELYKKDILRAGRFNGEESWIYKSEW